MSSDDKLASDLTEGVLRLAAAFKMNHLNPPKKISVPHDTYMRLKMLRPTNMYNDPESGWRIEIAGVVFEPAR